MTFKPMSIKDIS